VVGALTNSGIAVLNKDASQTQPLQAGQLLVIVKGQFQGLYDFDLQNFYETSELTEGLDLTRQNTSATVDPAIASVQAEIIAALATQSPVAGQGVVENPAFLDLTSTSSSVTDDNSNQEVSSTPDDSLVNSLIETGEVLFQNAQRPTNNIDDFSTNPSNNPIDTPIPASSNSGNNPSVGSEQPSNHTPGGNPGNDKPVGGAGENPSDNQQGGNNNPGGGNPGNDKPVGGAGENPSDNQQGGDNNPGSGNPGNDKPVGGAGENPSDNQQGGDNNSGGDEEPTAP
jgi:hypothetical protein